MRVRGLLEVLCLSVAGCAIGAASRDPSPTVPATTATATPPSAEASFPQDDAWAGGAGDVTPPEPTASATPPAAPQASAPAESPNACAPPDRGWGGYPEYRPIGFGKARLSIPKIDPPPEDGGYDVLFHFHFHDAVRRSVVHAGIPIAFGGLDLGEGSKVYGETFSSPSAFPRLRAAIEAALREAHPGAKTHLRKLYLSSWSAGFGATTKILKQHPASVAGVFFLDSLYAPYEKDEQGDLRKGKVFAPAVRPVLPLARRARKGDAFFFLSFSRAETIGYASTEEVARFLSAEVGFPLSPLPASEDPRGPVARADSGHLHVRGFGGSDAKAHCNHLRQVADALALLRTDTAAGASQPPSASAASATAAAGSVDPAGPGHPPTAAR